MWSDYFSSLRARDNRYDLEGYAGASPLEYPHLNDPQVAALHELKASTEIGLDPAIDVLEAIWNGAATIANALVDRLKSTSRPPVGCGA